MMRVPSLFCLSILIPIAACSVGAGSSYVGQWRAREQVEFNTCLEDESGQCSDRRQVVSHIPERKFWGVHMVFPAVGVSFVDIDGQRETKFRMELSGEFLKGRGNFAAGGRIGGVIDAGEKATISAPMMMAMGHIGLIPRLAAYGGVGMSPYNSFQEYANGEPVGPALTSHLGFRGLAGLQLVLTQTQGETRIVLSLEADRLQIYFDEMDYLSWGLVFHLGIFI